MAYTSIIPVRRLDSSIRYIQDREKTVKRADSLEDALHYALNREKTETSIFEDAFGCTCESAYADMLATQKRFHKTGGIQGYHLIQSFAKGEVTPELAHAIGQELAEQLLRGKYEVVITTHLNTEHYHNHLVFNSVSLEDGSKYRSNQKSYYGEIRRISDSLCQKYGLSIIEARGKGMDYSEWKAEKEGKPTWRTAIRLDIRDAVKESYSWNQFVKGMEEKGYVWKLDRKYTALRAPGMERFVRLKSLGKGYTEDAIRQWILRPKKGKGDRPEHAGKKRKLTGLQALYYSYLYQMGVLRQRPKRVSAYVRSDIRKLEKRIRQMEFLQEHDITTREGLDAYRKPLEERVVLLLKERQGLYRKAPGSDRIKEIGAELAGLRRDIRMCVQITAHSQEMEQRLLEAEREKERMDREKEQENRQKERGRRI